jgi:hypothetical protein
VAFDGDHELAGLEVTMRRLSIGALLEIGALADDDDMGSTAALVDKFAAALVEWNVEDDDGQPVGTDRDSVHGQDIQMILEIVDAWQHAAAGVSGPLAQRSSDGQPSEVVPLPMETLSASPPP